ncbi:hypothetical protein F4823DRAFT_638049 [Ustulina deusta]|nr:hypothetical protein F4823DRAFT_638049 [Ustulina deusta]
MGTTGEGHGSTIRYLLSQYPIQRRIIHDLDTRSILNLCRTSSGLREDLRTYLWDINKKLGRFFQDPVAFRAELGRADALISGSFALQFFANKFWPESDLDINLREGEGVESLGKYLVEAEGYELTRNQDIELLDYDTFCRLQHIERIVTYTKSAGGGRTSSQVLKVQLVATKNHPVAAILGTYYTSCIVNFISWNKAYCVFPRATLLFRETVVLTHANDYDVELHKKYSRRGWRLRTRPVNLGRRDRSKKYPRDTFPLGVCLGQDRRIGGADTWTMKLGTAGVARPPQPDSVLEYSNASSIRIHIDVFKSPSLRYEYTFGSLQPYWSYVGGVLTGNTRGQLRAKMIQSEADSIEAGGRLYDAEFPKPDGWDFWDDWLPDAFEEVMGT